VARAGAEGGRPGFQDRPQTRGADAAAARGIAAARAEVAAGQHEEALDGLEQLVREHPGSAPLLAELGWTNFLFAQDLIARSAGSAAVIDGALADAERWLEAALEKGGESVAVKLRLLTVIVERGSWKEARQLAAELPGLIRARGHVLDEADRIQLLLDTAKANLRSYAEALDAGEKGDVRMAELATASLTEAIEVAEKSGTVPERVGLTLVEVYQRLARVEAWLGRPAAAVAVLKRGVQRLPGEPALLGSIVDTAVEKDEPALAVAAIEEIAATRSRDAAVVWYLGRALFAQAISARRAGPEALAGFAQAAARFAESKRLEAGFTDSSDQWIALAKVGEGFVHYERQELEKARGAWLAAVRLRPDRREAEIATGRSAKTGIGMLVDTYAATDLAAAERLLREASAAAPDDADWAGSHGRRARELADALARQGQQAEAKALFEAAVESWRRVVRLAPEDPRALTECATILAWRLERELPAAQAMLQKAVELGEDQLAEAQHAGAEARDALAETVGDAYQNLGRLFLEQESLRDLGKARECLEKSLALHPEVRRVAARQMLDLVEELLAKQAGSRPAAGKAGGGR
jgi:tetratricopeptide (TPR) repeat protein